LDSLEQARRIAGIAQDKLADDVVILDMRPACVFTDFFVIASGRNTRQVKSIWDEVHVRLKQEERLIPHAVDGARESTWIVADYLDVVLHVFTPDTRAYYRLEDLWGDVPSVELEAASAKSKTAMAQPMRWLPCQRAHDGSERVDRRACNCSGSDRTQRRRLPPHG
jgi:ribosome-associated protein